MNFDYQKALLDVFTSQLVAHGAYLFASLTASISFMRYVETWISKKRSNKFQNFLKEKNSLIAITGSTVLISLTSYTLFRILYVAQLANQTLKMTSLPEKASCLIQYHQHVVNIKKT